MSIYRPQFAYASPEGCRDEDYVYFFDASNTPLLNQNVSGLNIPFIPLVLDQDTAFYWRGFKVGAIRELSGGEPVLYDFPNFSLKLRDCYQNDLSDDLVPACLYGFPSNPLSFNSALLTGAPVPLDPEIYCPPGGVITLFLSVPTLAAGTWLPSISLYGVKRYKECA